MTTKTTITVYAADSINCGRCGKYGRYSPNTSRQDIVLARNGRRWYISLPLGSAMYVGNGGKRDTEARFSEIVDAANSANGYGTLRWRTDRETVEAESDVLARERHDAACERKTYRIAYKEPITV